MIDIKGLDKAEVLASLYNHAKPLGLGLLHYNPKPMTRDEAQEILDNGSNVDYPSTTQRIYFDYLNGRVMKVNLGGDSFDEGLYDRDNGQGAAFAALRDLLSR